VGERAADDGQVDARGIDRAAVLGGDVAVEGAARQAQGGAEVRDGPAVDARGPVVDEGATVQREAAAGVLDAAPGRLAAVGDGQAGHADVAGMDVEDPVAGQPVDDRRARAGPHDGDVVGNVEVARRRRVFTGTGHGQLINPGGDNDGGGSLG